MNYSIAKLLFLLIVDRLYSRDTKSKVMGISRFLRLRLNIFLSEVPKSKSKKRLIDIFNLP